MRAVEYLQTPCPSGFDKHMIDGIGLSERDRAIAWAFRQKSGDMEFYADLAKMPRKKFNSVCGWIFRCMMSELIRLAIIGWRTEQNK